MHPTKTKIVYCRDSKRRGPYPNVTLDFLGYAFRPRTVWGTQSGRLFCGFTPAVSSSALHAMRETIRDLHIRKQTQLSLDGIARLLNPLLRGWIGYYGRYAPTELLPLHRYVNQTLRAWALRKFKRFRRRKTRAGHFLQELAAKQPALRANDLETTPAGSLALRARIRYHHGHAVYHRSRVPISRWR